MNELKFIKDFKTFVDEINKSNSRAYKLNTLKKYKNNDCIKYFLQQIYDPYLIFGISDKKLNKNVYYQSGTIWLDCQEDSVIFDYLKTHNTGTDIDIWTVQQYRDSHICDDCKELFDKIVTKNLQLGVSTKSINDIFGKDTIKEFKVQLAEKFFDQKENFFEGKEFALTTKIDGSRIIAMKDAGKVSFWTRQGQKYEGLVDLEKDLLECTDDNFVFDGELVAIDTDLENTYKNTMKLSRTKELEKHGLKMLVFDYMPIANFKAQKCPIDYSTRRAQLSAIFDLNCFKYFELLPILYKGTDTSKIVEILNEQVAAKNEGIMINICNAPYDFKRTNNLLKCKKMQTLDLEVIGFEEGTNSNKGTLGALLVRYKDNNIVKVGSGFEKELRDEIWLNQAKWLGRIVEVQYFEETTNANGGKSIRFPVYKDYRTDKTEADY